MFLIGHKLSRDNFEIYIITTCNRSHGTLSFGLIAGKTVDHDQAHKKYDKGNEVNVCLPIIPFFLVFVADLLISH